MSMGKTRGAELALCATSRYILAITHAMPLIDPSYQHGELDTNSLNDRCAKICCCRKATCERVLQRL